MFEYKKKKKKRVLHSFIGLVLILIIAMGGVAYGLLWQGTLPEFKVSSTVNVLSKVALAEITGKTVNLKSQDLNGILELYLKKKNSQGSLTIKNIYSEMQDDKLSFYIPAKYKKFSFLLYCKGTISYDNNKIVFKPTSIKVGKISIPVTFALNKLKSYSSKITISENAIELPKDILPFNVTELSISGDSMLAKIEKITTFKNTEPDKEINTDVLKSTRDQLVAVYSSLQTKNEKKVISTIQTVVDKMIKSPSYAYKNDAKSVKASYTALTSAEKYDIKNSLLTDMDTNT